MTNYDPVGDRAARDESRFGHGWVMFRGQVISGVLAMESAGG